MLSKEAVILCSTDFGHTHMALYTLQRCFFVHSMQSKPSTAGKQPKKEKKFSGQIQILFSYKVKVGHTAAHNLSTFHLPMVLGIGSLAPCLLCVCVCVTSFILAGSFAGCFVEIELAVLLICKVLHYF